MEFKVKEKLSMVLSMVIFGTIGIFVKYIGIPSGVIAATRGIIGSIVIFVVMLFAGHKIEFKKLKKKLPVLLASGVAIGFNWILLFEAYRYTGIPVATVCYYTAPIIVVIASSFIFKEKLKSRQIICVIVALIGVALVSGIFQNNNSKFTGVICGLGAAGLYASIMIMNKFMGNVEVYERTVIQLGSAGLVVLPYALLTMEEMTLNLKSTILLVVVGVVHTGFAYLLYFGAMKKLESQTVAILSYIDPASAIILSSVVFRQLPSIYEFIGVVFIMTAAILSEIRKKGKVKSMTDKQINITGAIFDFDGTLFDSMHVWKGYKDNFFNYLGIELTEEDKEAFKGLFLQETFLLAIERFNLKYSYEELLSMLFEYIKARYLTETEPKNDIIEFLEKLKAKGVKMGIATATGEPALIAVLEKYGMLHYFSAIYSTYTVGASKTEPKVYDVVLREIGTEKETTWVFEDALYAAKTAKANGYNVVGIFDKSEPNQDELKELVDKYIHNYKELEL